MLENIYHARAGSKTASSQSLHQPSFLLPPLRGQPIYFYLFVYVSVNSKFKKLAVCRQSVNNFKFKRSIALR